MKLTTQVKLIKLKIDREYYRELLWQVKLSYRLAFVCTVFSVILIFTGIICGIFGQISIGLVSVVIGLVIDRVSKLWLGLWCEAKHGFDRDNC